MLIVNILNTIFFKCFYTNAIRGIVFSYTEPIIYQGQKNMAKN